MYNNDYGIQFNGAHYQYITNSQTYQNNVDGVDIDNSTMLDIAQLRSVMNNEIGCDIEPGYTTELNGMYDCDFNYNGNTGLRLIRCVLNLYNWDCRMNNNGRYGLYLYWGSDYNRFYNCSGVGNGRSNKNDRGYRNYFDNNCYFP